MDAETRQNLLRWARQARWMPVASPTGATYVAWAPSQMLTIRVVGIGGGPSAVVMEIGNLEIARITRDDDEAFVQEVHECARRGRKLSRDEILAEICRWLYPR